MIKSKLLLILRELPLKSTSSPTAKLDHFHDSSTTYKLFDESRWITKGPSLFLPYLENLAYQFQLYDMTRSLIDHLLQVSSLHFLSCCFGAISIPGNHAFVQSMSTYSLHLQLRRRLLLIYLVQAPTGCSQMPKPGGSRFDCTTSIAAS